jgi:di/tricarboxylate transporter
LRHSGRIGIVNCGLTAVPERRTTVTPEILLVLAILAAAVVLLISEWIPMEVTALLALGAVAVTGLLKPAEALAGFSNPAVVTVWAVFILSGGLTRTGVANVIGAFVLRLAGRREATMVVVIMATAGVLSAVMNNVAVAALMLPVVMDIARHTGSPPGRLLLPLAYGSLLGGLTTQIGTPPNILVTDALREAGFESFAFFDFTPVGLAVMAAGTAFMALVGRHLLPRGETDGQPSAGGGSDYKTRYDLLERLFYIRVPAGSSLTQKTLSQIGMGSILGWNVIAICRGEHCTAAPGPEDSLQSGDLLTVQGRLENLSELKNWYELEIVREDAGFRELLADSLTTVEVLLERDSPAVGGSLASLDFRGRFRVNVLAIRRDGKVKRTNLQDDTLQAGDVLLLSGPPGRIVAMKAEPGFGEFREVAAEKLEELYQLVERLMVMRVPPVSGLVGRSLRASRLGDALGLHVLGVLRGDGPPVVPDPEERLLAGDRLLVLGRLPDFGILRGLEEMGIVRENRPNAQDIVAGDAGLMEAILSPQTTIEGKSLRQINFREKYGLNVLALWRKGKAFTTELRDMKLRFGDALLLLGPRAKLQMLGREPEFIILTQAAQEEVRSRKMRLALLILGMVLLPVLLGWVPIYIAAVVGAALMVLTGCLTMEEAYRQIEWKAVFLIAGMLPLGVALDRTGAARLIAEGVVGLVGPYGPNAVMLGLIALTFLATCFVPTAALVVLMAPIVLNTSANMGLAPQGLMMAVAMAASASFATPISHPANILVMGPGGYRFMDYLRVGGLLTLVTLVVLMAVMPVFWPLSP